MGIVGTIRNWLIGKPEKRTAKAVVATYDAARTTDDFKNYWANADALNADSANSKQVRSTLVSRSRYEVANNGYVDGIAQTYATDLVGTGPKLRMQTGNADFNRAVEAVWKTWSAEIMLRRKLWTMAHAKLQDGEGFAICRSNPRINHKITLDLVLIETEQCQSLYSVWGDPQKIDGIKFDEFGNPETYEVLKYHPGSGLLGGVQLTGTSEIESVPARFMLHWFQLRRPGQHRGVPELRSTLNVGAASRRWREATVAAAETAADFAAVLHTDMPAGDSDPTNAFSTVELQKRMMTAMPMGWSATQMKAEHPNATYEAFNKSQISEQARPKSMPFNKAACDSSSYNYASGRLDHQTYYAALDVEREDANDLVLTPLFRLFWAESVLAYGWNADPMQPPVCSFDWPRHPVADIVSEANSNNTRLRNGSASLGQIYTEVGEDFDDRIPVMATEYGVTEEELRKALFNANFNASNQQASMGLVENLEAQTAARNKAAGIGAQPNDN
jgi:capsid protein